MASKKYGLSLFLFRRDLRLYDNTGLREACRLSEKVVPCFFLHNDLLDPDSEKYRPNLIQFMIESLSDLSDQLEKSGAKLHIFGGDSLFKIFEKVIAEDTIEAVFVNEDYTPYSQRRDSKLRKICQGNGVEFNTCFDCLLSRPGDVLTKDGRPYKVFTPFFKSVSGHEIVKPIPFKFKNLVSINKQTEDLIQLKKLYLKNNSIAQHGGRKKALKRLKIIKNFSNYSEIRNYPYKDGTTRLSAHIKFGTVSIREVYWRIRNELGKKNQIITELFWRDFYAHLAYFFPHVFGSSFNYKFTDLRWENNKQKFEAWCSGMTGFPIVDAGMRQLNKSGWMHNRVRMIVASFLTKDLHIDWRWGEKYFASRLVDYDPCSNNGGWQWAASTGADAQPYFRIFNPWRQQARFDPDAKYIKCWVPELSNFSRDEIHNHDERNLLTKNYPKPIVNHKREAEKSKKMYKA